MYVHIYIESGALWGPPYHRFYEFSSLCTYVVFIDLLVLYVYREREIRYLHQMWSYCGETQTCKSYLSGGEKAGDLSYLLLNKTKKDCLGDLSTRICSAGQKICLSLSLFIYLRGRESSYVSPEQKEWMHCGPEDLSLSLSLSVLWSEKAQLSSQNRRD